MTKPREFRSMYPHHIYNRGAMKTNIFLEPIDYNVFLKYLKQSCKIYHCRILAYCLMPNHYHLMLQPIEKDTLSKIMQISLSKYSLYIHKKYSWPGHIFQSRFQCKLISDIKYFDALVLYIENNPTEAKLTDIHGNYRWLKLYDNKIAKQRELLSMGID